jgi:5-formyltetrahydrofolate cyclo-ligase
MTLELKEIRANLLDLRRNQAPSDRLQKNQALIENLKSEFSQWALPLSARIALYCATEYEVSLESLDLWLSGRAVLYYPRITSTQPATFELVQATRADPSNWAPGRFGISEPQRGDVLEKEDALDVVFVPGAAFGVQGERLGLGAGFYDRFFERCRKALRIGVGFDFQLQPTLPQNPWDQRMDAVFTEKRGIKTPRFQQKLDRLIEKK